MKGWGRSRSYYTYHIQGRIQKGCPGGGAQSEYQSQIPPSYSGYCALFNFMMFHDSNPMSVVEGGLGITF